MLSDDAVVFVAYGLVSFIVVAALVYFSRNVIKIPDDLPE